MLAGRNNAGDALREALSAPTVWAITLGLLFGATGLYNALKPSGVSQVLDALTDFVSAPTSVLILLAIGYDLDPAGIQWRKIGKLMGLRLGVSGLLLCLVLLVDRLVLGHMMHTGALRMPAFVAAMLGIAVGVSGLGQWVLGTRAGVLYTETIGMMTSPLSAMILVVVGYSIVPKKEMLLPCLKTIALRVVLQAVMILGMILSVHHFIGVNRVLDLAIITYMSAPATFSMQAFVKDPDASAYVSTTNALYCFVSVAVYAVAVAL